MNVFELVARIFLDSKEYDEGLEGAKSKATSFKDKAGGILQSAGKAGAVAIGAITTAAAGASAGFIKATGRVAEYGDNIDKMSQKIGISSEAYQEWDAVFQHSGTSIDVLQGGMKTLRTAMDSLGQSTGESTVNQRKLEQAQSAYKNKLVAVEKAQIAYNEAVQKHGEGSTEAAKASLNLETAVNNAEVALSKVNAAAEGTKPKMSDAAAALLELGVAATDSNGNLRDEEDVFADVVTALQGMENETDRTRIASLLLGRSGTELGALLNTTAEETQAMKDRVHELGGVLSDDAVKAAAAYQDSLQDMTTAFDGLQRGMVAEFLPSVTTVMDGLTEIFSGNPDSGIALLNEGIGGFVENMMEAIPKVLEVGKGIVSALGQAILDNLPELISMGADIVIEIGTGVIGALPDLIITVIPALITAIIGIVDSLKEKLPEILDSLAVAFSGVVDMISEHLNEKNPVLGEAFDAAVEIVKTAFNGIVEFWDTTLKPALDGIWTFMTETLAPEVADVWETIIQPAITTVMDVISTTWESVLKPALEAIWTFIKDTLAPAVKTAWEDTIKPAITGVIDTVKDKWENVLKPALEKFQAFLDETLVPAVKKAWEENIQPAITTVMEKVSDVWNNILKPVFTAIRDFVVDTLAPIIKDRWENVIKPAIAGIMEHIGWVWDTILSPALSALYDFVVDKVVPAAESFGEKFEWLNDTILSPLATFLKDVFLSALRGVRNFVETYVLPTVKRIGEKLQTFHDTIISPLSDFIDDNVVPAFEGFSGVLDDLYGFLEPVGDFVQNTLIGAFEGAKAIVDTVISTIVSAIEWAQNALEKIREFREANAQAQSEYDNYVSNQVSQGTYYGPGFAKGGSLRSGSVWVGEEAPEILTVHNGIATVTPVKGSGRHTPVSSNVTFNVYAQPGQDEVAIAREVQKQFLRWDKQERAAMG